MNTLRQYLGWLWMLSGPAAILFLLYEAVQKISKNPSQDVYLPWIIIIVIFTPIAAGLVLFGWYAWKDDYRIDAPDKGEKP